VEIVSYVAVAVLAYLLGSIPTGFLVAHAKGVDIRAVGSGNIGATNVLRTLGKPAGIVVLLVDALKGWLAVVPMPRLVVAAFGIASDPLTLETFQIIAGVCAILGHNYTCWLNFKGGKGIATSAGVLLALVPWALVTILTIWIIVFALTRYVSLASLAASAALPFASWLTHESLTKVIVTGAMGVLAIYKHRANIQRLLNGTEPRFGRKGKEATP
jgi:acyl phosphate:glycerol-3-phosphate acyltransferase